MKGRPKIDRELVALNARLARINAGLLACYETIEIGQRKKAAVEAAIRAHSTVPAQADTPAPEER